MAHEEMPSGAIVVPVGSRVTCDPPPTDTDQDYLVLVSDKRAAIESLKSIGFEYSADPEKVEEYQRMNETAAWSFTSMWFGDVNYIITDSQFFFERFLTATHVCKKLNLMKKEDRVMVFEAVRGGSFYSEVVPEWVPPYPDWVTHGKSGSKSTSGLTEDLLAHVRSVVDAKTTAPFPF